MEARTLVTISLVVAVVSSAGPRDFRANSAHEKDVYDVFDILMRHRAPERYLPKSYLEKFGTHNSSRLTQFSFRDCGSPGRETVKIFDLGLSPDPLRLPGQVGLSFKAENVKSAQAPIQAAVTLKKKIVFWIEVPCVDNVGSCTYSDICKYMPASCPKPFVSHKIPCNCPVPTGNFTLPETMFPANVAHVPGGDYSAKIVLKSQSGPLACINIDFSIA